jgi:hypothetical protein
VGSGTLHLSRRRAGGTPQPNMGRIAERINEGEELRAKEREN